jgi:membrane protease YdiL (CAAX protease family)
VAAFVLLTFAATWSWWLAVSALLPAAVELAFLPGTLMPAMVALLLARRESSRSVRDLAGRVLQWRAAAPYYLFALTFLLMVKLGAAALFRVHYGAWPEFGTTPLIVLFVGVLISTPVQAGEEIGWRGFMLQRLARRMGFAWASLVVGLVWAAWHLPMFFMRGGNMVGQSFPLFALIVTALSVALAWLYARTDGSLLLPMILHAAANNTSGIVPYRNPVDPDRVFAFSASPVAWLTAALLWLVAALLLFRLRTAPGGNARPPRSSGQGRSA